MHITGTVLLKHWCDFQQLPQNRGKPEGSGVLTSRRRLASDPTREYFCSHRKLQVSEGGGGCSPPRPASASHPPLRSTDAHVSTRQGKKGPEAETPAGAAFLCCGAGSGAHQKTAQENLKKPPLLNAATPLPCCGPTRSGRGSRGRVHVGRRLHLSRPDSTTGAYAS